MNPLPVLSVIAMVLAFEGLLFGQDIVASSFPAFNDVDFQDCFSTGFIASGFGLGYISCVVVQVFNIIVNFFKFLYGTVVFFVKLLSFDIGGAPTWIRYVLGSITTGTILWSIAGLARGSGS